MKKVRYAVVGLGYISQVAVLPAFAHAEENCELTALVSGDGVKRKKLARKYGVPLTYSYQQYDECLRSGQVDAVFIALPNNLHAEYTVRAAQAGVHVLCEKPMAVTEKECRRMIEACRKGGVKLMIAYRLHLEEANLRAVQMAQNGRLGQLRIFESVFTMSVKKGDIRLKRELGGGTLYDIGVYCINASRYLFRDEPVEVFAFTEKDEETRFREVDEMTSAILRFPKDRLAAFTSSFGAADTSSYRLIGTKGDLRLEPAYQYTGSLKHHLTINGGIRTLSFPPHDQFAAELIYFSRCVLENKQPQPSGEEGMADVRIIQALYRSAKTRRPVRLNAPEPARRPRLAQKIEIPPVDRPELIHAEPPRQSS